jgi:hypothetical protein
MRLLLAAGLIGLGLSGCQGAVGSPEEYEAGYARLACALQARCGGIGASELAACNRDGPAIVRAAAFGLINSWIAGGRVAFDGAAARRCLDDVGALDCGFHAPPSGEADCSAVFRGLVPVGGACSDSIQCAGGWCQQPAPSCSGVCRALVGAGGSCAAGEHCADALFCDPVMFVCTQKRSVGGPCLGGAQCSDGLICAGAAPFGQGGTCTVRPAGVAGDPCELALVGDSCAPAFSCSGGHCVARAAAGASCDPGSGCVDGFTCLASAGGMQSCTAWLDVGEACTTVNGSSACPADQICDSNTQRCTLPSTGIGVPCQSTADCSSGVYKGGAYCDPASLRCAVRPTIGDACTPSGNEPCALGFCDPSTHVCIAPTC